MTTKLSKKGNKKRTNSIIAGYIYEIRYKRIGGKTLKYKYHCRINSYNNNRLHKNWREKFIEMISVPSLPPHCDEKTI